MAAPPVQCLIPANVILLGALWWWVVQMVALALAPGVFVLGAVYTVGALMGPIFQTTNAAYRYALTPDRLQGRVYGVSRMIGWCTVPLGALLGGVSLQTMGAVCRPSPRWRPAWQSSRPRRRRAGTSGGPRGPELSQA
ncbi:hypothetical protein [Streptomyces sp. NPDC048419]|uniref:hypothetical protein n=1 Tax=Streptomyces sp. NPDC048419 TaxID=3365547 RepID=UPI0037151505